MYQNCQSMYCNNTAKKSKSAQFEDLFEGDDDKKEDDGLPF